MEFRQIRYALAVAKDRNFTKAAQRLHISQSAVSEQVKLLETEIGFDLFKRTGHGIEATERGRMFLHEAERVAGDVLGLTDIARRLSGVGVDRLTLGIGSGLAPILLPRLFSKDNPRTNLHLEIKTAPTRVIFDELHNERLDMGIIAHVGQDRVPSGLTSTPIFDLDIVLILPPDHPLTAQPEPIEIARLVDEPLIMNELSIGYGEMVGNMFNDLGLRPRIKAVVDNVETIKVMVQTGLGIALIPAGSAELEAKSGLLALRQTTPSHSMSIHVYRAARGLSRNKELLSTQLIDSAAALVEPKT